MIWIPAATASRFSAVRSGESPGADADHDRDRRAQVLGARLFDLLRRVAVGLHGVGDHIAEAGPGVAFGDREPPRPRPLVVRCPLGQLAQLADQLARHVALLVDQHAGAAATNQVCEVGRLHAAHHRSTRRPMPAPFVPMIGTAILRDGLRGATVPRGAITRGYADVVRW